MTNKFTSEKASAEITKQAAAFARAASHLGEAISNELCTPEMQKTMMQVLDGGGRVGLELTVDRHAANLLSLVAIEREGRHLTLLSVRVKDAPNSGVAH